MFGVHELEDQKFES
jgi:hypothetical protein